ncbi:dihydroxy-acid dehydratase [Moniliophthora roreri]|nr:dihydroxy-acid dehydratase [Moniliophthora roreri]
MSSPPTRNLYIRRIQTFLWLAAKLLALFDETGRIPSLRPRGKEDGRIDDMPFYVVIVVAIVEGAQNFFRIYNFLPIPGHHHPPQHYALCPYSPTAISISTELGSYMIQGRAGAEGIGAARADWGG